MSSHCLLMGLNFIGAGYAPNTGLPVCFRVRTESLRVRSINSISKKKEGLNKGTIVEQWLDQLLLFEKAKAELKIVQKSRNELNAKYLHFAPVGTTIKRKERIINFTEQNYLRQSS